MSGIQRVASYAMYQEVHFHKLVGYSLEDIDAAINNEFSFD